MRGFLVTTMICGWLGASSQNLVPNPGFEPTFPGIPKYWSHPKAGCDHTMKHVAGETEGAHTGVGYHGLCMFSIDHPLKDESEYLSVKLMEPLEAGRGYCLSMWARVSSNYNEGLDRLDGVGWLFTSTLVTVTNGTRNSCSREQYVEPQLQFALVNASPPFRWVKYEVLYVATGNEKFLTIGDFKDPSKQRKKDRKDRRRAKRGIIALPSDEAYFNAYYVRVFFDDISIKAAPEPTACTPNVVVVTDSVIVDTIHAVVTDTLEIGERVILKNIFFDFDSASLKPESYPELDRLIDLLVRYPTLRIKINGHTDDHGTPEYNVDLSNRRARTVVEYLLAHRISESRLSYEGFGEAQPISEDDAVNRRVEFEVVSL